MLKSLFDIVMPPKCLSCNNIVEMQGSICAECYPALRVVGKHKCHKCGLPFDFDHGSKALCTPCTNYKPAYDMARAFCSYEGLGGDMATKLKFSDKTHLARHMAALMCAAGSGLIKKSDIITAVPLHYKRKLRRKYNQSAMLAKYIASYSGADYEPFLLKRIRNTQKQTTLPKSERGKNVKDAFLASPIASEKRILVIDDVMTTGATLSECARALKKQGARKVYGLVFARVE